MPLAVTLFLCIDLDYVGPTEGLDGFRDVVDRICRSFPSEINATVFLLAWFAVGSLFLLYSLVASREDKKLLGRKLLIVPSLFFAFAQVFGYVLDKKNGIGVLSSGAAQYIKSAFSFAAWAVLFYVCVSFLFFICDRYLDRRRGEAGVLHMKASCDSEAEGAREGSALRRKLEAFSDAVFRDHPFLGPLVVLLIAWLPVFVGYAPGLFMGDTGNQIYMWYGLENVKAQMVDLIDPNVTMTSHYPVFHTVMVGLCVQAGQALFGDVNVGVLLYSILQSILTLLSVSYAFLLLKELRAPLFLRLSCLLILIFVPWYSGYSVLLTRDTLFADGLLVFCLQTVLLQRKTRLTAKDTAVLVVSALFLTFMRNGGALFSLAGLAILAIRCRPRKMRKVFVGVSACMLGVLACYCACVFIVFPAMHVTPGNKAEALSIPFQQTARYVSGHADSITNKERKAIDGVLVFDGLAERYNARLSDPVKDYAALHRHNVSAEQWIKYAKAWVSMGLKDPYCYFVATLNNYYGYFFIGSPLDNYYGYDWSTKMMVQPSKTTGFNFQHSSAEPIRLLADIDTAYAEVFQRVPVVSLFMNSAFWCWALVLVSLYSRHRGWGVSLPALITLWAIMLVFLAGPCNGVSYNRYVFPLALALPFLISALFGVGVTGHSSSVAEEACTGDGSHAVREEG